MTWIFPRFAPGPGRRLISGRKKMTFRLKKLGEIGDRFSYKGHAYEITRIWPMRAEQAIKLHYKNEGYNSPADMERDLLKFYPDLEYWQKGYVHVLKEIKIEQTKILPFDK